MGECPFCKAPIDITLPLVKCSNPNCQIIHHADCWSANGGCAVFGCGSATSTPVTMSAPISTTEVTGRGTITIDIPASTSKPAVAPSIPIDVDSLPKRLIFLFAPALIAALIALIFCALNIRTWLSLGILSVGLGLWFFVDDVYKQYFVGVLGARSMFAKGGFYVGGTCGLLGILAAIIGVGIEEGIGSAIGALMGAVFLGWIVFYVAGGIGAIVAMIIEPIIWFIPGGVIAMREAGRSFWSGFGRIVMIAAVGLITGFLGSLISGEGIWWSLVSGASSGLMLGGFAIVYRQGIRSIWRRLWTGLCIAGILLFFIAGFLISYDRIPPKILGIVPADGSTFKASQPPDAIDIQFSEKIKPDSAMVTVNNGQFTGTISYDADTKMLTFQPTKVFYPGTTYTVTVKGVKDKANNVMTENSFSFTIESIVVAKDGSGDFSTIKAALDAAVEGATVLIKAGTYNEAIRLKEGVHVRGEGAENTILTYSGDAPVVRTENLSEGSLTYVTVEYKGKGYNQPSIDIVLSDITISHCIVTGGTHSGFQIRNKSKATIKENQIRGNALGIAMYDDAKPIIQNNQIENNGIKSNYAGIQVSDNAAPTIENNQILNNVGTGIFVYGDAKPLIKNNIIEQNKRGILVKERAVPTIEDNQIRNNDDIGVWVYDDAKPIIKSNTIEKNGIDNKMPGIYVRDNAAPTIENNQIRNNVGTGIFVYGDAKSIIKGNTIEKNGKESNLSGIEVREHAAPTIKNNQILNNGGSGVYVYGDAKPIVQNNTIEQNKFYGINIRENAKPQILNNQIRNNGDNGIYVHGEARPNIVSNVITGHLGYGIYISEQAQPTLKDNTIKDNESGDIYRTKLNLIFEEGGQAQKPNLRFEEGGR